MMVNPEFPLRESDILDLVPGVTSALIVFDVDLTLTNGVGRAHVRDLDVRPGVVDLIRSLVSLGHQVHIWTAGGKDHADFITEHLGINDIIIGASAKVDFPPQQKDVIALLGRLPDVTVDDTVEEAVPGVPILEVEAFWGRFAEEDDDDS